MNALLRRLPHGSVALTLSALLAALSAGAAHAGYKEGMEALALRDFARARAEFEADRANVQSLIQLSRMARLGLGEPRDESRATSLLRQAADMGDTNAKLDYALALGNGTGTPRDTAQAVRLLDELIAAGNTEAMIFRGRAWRNAWWDQPRDEARAVAMFQKALDAGDDDARVPLASMLQEGLGTAKDEARAAQIVREGAERNHLGSQTEYARVLTFGIGVPRDEAAGTALYQKAAERDDRVAQFSLGLSYLRGRGIARDDRLAAVWLDLAARQGWPWAQLQLADLYRAGIGVPRVRSEAYFWYAVAARSTTAPVAERANLQRAAMANAQEVSDADVQRLTARAAQFRPQTGLKPRLTPQTPPVRGDRIEVGGTSLRVPMPRGYFNGWQTIEWILAAYPNDPDHKAWQLVMNSQEDFDRMKLGLPGGLRSIELLRHQADDSVRITPQLFTELKAQTRSSIDSGVAAGRFLMEGVLRDDDRALGILRASVTDPNRIEAISLVYVRDRVLLVAYTGFNRQQKDELAALVRSLTDDILSANRPGLFSN